VLSDFTARASADVAMIQRAVFRLETKSHRGLRKQNCVFKEKNRKGLSLRIEIELELENAAEEERV
jgi:hypothetical protein